MYRLIASDLDETLLGPDHHISQENLAAIRKCQELGIKFVPATGRGFGSIQQTLEELGIKDAPGQYAITYNGGAIYENQGPRLISLTGMDYGLIEELYERGQKYGVCMHIYSEDKVFAYNLTDEEREFCRGRLDLIEITDPTLDRLRESGEKFVKILYENPDFAKIKQIRSKMGDMEERTEMSCSSSRYLEFNPVGVNKGNGLKRLCAEIGLDLRETMALGDSFNDDAMIKAAGLGVGMANTTPEMRADCDVITEHDYLHGGVAEAIERFVLPQYQGK